MVEKDDWDVGSSIEGHNAKLLYGNGCMSTIGRDHSDLLSSSGPCAA